MTEEKEVISTHAGVEEGIEYTKCWTKPDVPRHEQRLSIASALFQIRSKYIRATRNFSTCLTEFTEKNSGKLIFSTYCYKTPLEKIYPAQSIDMNKTSNSIVKVLIDGEKRSCYAVMSCYFVGEEFVRESYALAEKFLGPLTQEFKCPELTIQFEDKRAVITNTSGSMATISARKGDAFYFESSISVPRTFILRTATGSTCISSDGTVIFQIRMAGGEKQLEIVCEQPFMQCLQTNGVAVDVRCNRITISGYSVPMVQVEKKVQIRLTIKSELLAMVKIIDKHLRK